MVRISRLRTRFFATIACACLVVAITMGYFSRQAASRGFSVMFDSHFSAEGSEGVLHDLDDKPHPLTPREVRELNSDYSDLELHSVAQHSFDRTMLLVLLGVVAVALLATRLLSAWIVGPVERLTHAARRLREGHRDGPIPVVRQDELGDLAVSLNELTVELERTESLRQNLVHDVAHELRTPLTALQGQVEAMQDGLLKVEAASLDALHSNIRHLSSIVEDLQELAQAEAGRLRLDCQPLDLSEAIQRWSAALESDARVQGIQLDVDLQDALTVQADALRTRQVLGILMSNAITHTPAGKRIQISARRLTGYVQISVSDEGAGIPAADLPHIFERFYRADPARQRSGGGVGLGLAIARQLVLAQGGEIEAQSVEGAGATLRFTLPLSD